MHLVWAFAIELLTLSALALWGLNAAAGWFGWLTAVGVPALLAVVWSIFAAPRSSARLAPAPLLLFKVLVYGLAAAALQQDMGSGWAFAYAMAMLSSVLAGACLRQ